MKPEPVRLNAAIYPHFIEISTRFGDMDINGHLNNVAYARFFEEARVTVNRKILTDPVSGERLLALAGFKTLVASVSISYLREGAYGPPIRVGIGLSRIGNASFSMGAAAFQEEACLATHDAVIACKGPDGSGIPADIRAVFETHMLRI